jgi:hypothetical protein
VLPPAASATPNQTIGTIGLMLLKSTLPEC